MRTMLNCRTDFSVGESILTVERLVEEVKRCGQPAVAITDTMSVTGMIDFTNRASKADIKPIIGVRLRLTDNPTWRPGDGEKKKDMPREYFLTLYALTEEGMLAIYRLLTLANSDARFYYVPKLGFDDLYQELKNVKGGLAVHLGDERSVVEHPDIDKIAFNLTIDCDHVYAPMIAVNTPYFGRINQISADLTTRFNLKPILTRPALYDLGHADAQEIMTAISENQKITDGWFRSRYNRDMHPMSSADMMQEIAACARHLAARGIPNVGTLFREAVLNGIGLVNLVVYKWKKAPVSLPKMAPDEFEAVKKACLDGWKTRFSAPVFAHQPTAQEQQDIYKPRLAYELSTLKKLGFSGYFLLVQDIVQFAKKNGILVGPGRGSVGGSLVAYLMGITDCDPVRFGLLFERFINPDRLDLPDADLDFMSERRHEIVTYLVNKYGENRVAGVSNFGTLAAASAMRDVGRVTGIPERDFSVSKLVPKLHGQNVPLPQCREAVAEIDAFAKNYPDYWEIMETLEGTIRNFSQHAAGMVVAGCDLVERAVVETRKESSVVCWDKRIVEDQGLVKVDILGLKTLDVINLACNYIRERHGKAPDLNRIDLTDKGVLDRFAAGKTTGVFQYEGGGARRMLREMGSSGVSMTFEDVGAVSALNRPGPLEAGLDKMYIENREGSGTISFVSKYTQAALSDTYGAIVYQEQVMQIAKDLSGFTGAESDVLRKAIGKKDPVMMKKMKDQFVSGAVSGYAEITLEDGSKRIVHLNRKYKVLESNDKFTISEIHSLNYTLSESL